ncbi:MAG TPA: phage regulatory CII family protein [Aquabacterium sp.]|nr:phage regulatory CII family protein [Aquabacterium sp.]
MSTKGAAGAIPDNPVEAFREVVHSFGVKQLAALLLMKPGTLYNKADGDVDSHHQPTLRDVVRVTQATNNMLILDSLDRMFNRAAYDVTPGIVVSDQELLDLLCRVNSESGAMHKALTDGYLDRHFSAADLRRVRAEVFDLVTAVLTFLHRLEGLVDD